VATSTSRPETLLATKVQVPTSTSATTLAKPVVGRRRKSKHIVLEMEKNSYT
jgi:hypothetical protein